METFTQCFVLIIGLVTLINIADVDCRKRHLVVVEDSRPIIHLSSFGLYQEGSLHVNLSHFHPSDGPPVNLSKLVVGFTIDRSLSDGLNPYNEGERNVGGAEDCILNRKITEMGAAGAGIIRFLLNFETLTADIECSQNMQGISISMESPNKRGAEDELSDNNILPVHRPAAASQQDTQQDAKRQKRNMKSTDMEDMLILPLDREILSNQDQEIKPRALPIKDYNKVTEEISDLNKKSIIEDKSAKEEPKQPTDETGVAVIEPRKLTEIVNTEDKCSKHKIPIHREETGYLQMSFKFSITEIDQEGLYSIFFHNCQQQDGESAPLDFEIKIEEKNRGENYLSAGEMPLPALYQMLSILFLLTGCFWVFILKKNGSEQVFRIHWIMAALVFLKSLSLFFHGVNYAKIAANGHHIETWAVLYYITHLIKGGLLFFTIVLIGSGWAFIKHILSSKEKRVFMIILPLQVLANVAYIIVEESEEGAARRATWKEMFILIDLICCGAILLPVVWSIKHLQDASSTDGKAAMSLEKLKLFRHFYIMVVCYVYLTRIVVYLLKITIPFQYSWFDDTFKEMITFAFFVMTGYKFRPASNNPYFSVPKDDEEMEQILISGSAIHDQAVIRKSYKVDSDEGDDEETVVLFSKNNELSHELD